MRTAPMLGFASAVNRDVRQAIKYRVFAGLGRLREGGQRLCDGSMPKCVAFSATLPAFAAKEHRRGSAVVFRMRPRRPARDIFGVTRAGGASTPQIRSISTRARISPAWRNRRAAIHVGATTSVLRS
jgi:hypothetical protein